jgi:hypothetical protein
VKPAASDEAMGASSRWTCRGERGAVKKLKKCLTSDIAMVYCLHPK